MQHMNFSGGGEGGHLNRFSQAYHSPPDIDKYDGKEERKADIQLYKGDCIKGMQLLKEGSVDAVITDPPYGIGYESKTGVKVKNDKRPYIWFLHEAYRVLKDGGSACVFCRWDVEQDFRRAMELAGFIVKSQIIWDKMYHGMGDTKAQWSPSHELILFGIKGKFAFPGGRPPDVLHVPKVPSAHMVHPTKKPVALIEQLISATTKKGDTILDPFAGSGSAAIAAINTERGYIGYEIDNEYYNIAKKRIEKA